jgi:hypothetical protein
MSRDGLTLRYPECVMNPSFLEPILRSGLVAGDFPAGGNCPRATSPPYGGAPDSVVRVEFTSRPGTCGDGRDQWIPEGVLRRIFPIDRKLAFQCVPGPVRVALTSQADR